MQSCCACEFSTEAEQEQYALSLRHTIPTSVSNRAEGTDRCTTSALSDPVRQVEFQVRNSKISLKFRLPDESESLARRLS